jgi:hypothetical protein
MPGPPSLPTADSCQLPLTKYIPSPCDVWKSFLLLSILTSRRSLFHTNTPLNSHGYTRDTLRSRFHTHTPEHTTGRPESSSRRADHALGSPTRRPSLGLGRTPEHQFMLLDLQIPPQCQTTATHPHPGRPRARPAPCHPLQHLPRQPRRHRHRRSAGQ